mmetsp:Transcript_18417/g.43041  ORF Transcript_18417/g.43041 Transcript_18417/m.43041 type:complete len:378 (-) Transcript_18417:162-1295(-)
MAQAPTINGSLAQNGDEGVCLGEHDPSTPQRKSKRWAAGVLTSTPESPKRKRQKCGSAPSDLSKESTLARCAEAPFVVVSSSSQDSGDDSPIAAPHADQQRAQDSIVTVGATSLSTVVGSPEAHPAAQQEPKNSLQHALEGASAEPCESRQNQPRRDQAQASPPCSLAAQQSVEAMSSRSIASMLGISAKDCVDLSHLEIDSPREQEVDWMNWSPSTMSVEELQHWMVFFGMSPSRNPGLMAQRLSEIDDFLRGTSGKNLARPTCTTVARGRPRLSTKPHQAMPKRRPTEKGDDLAQLLLDAIRADIELYERMLMYEAIEVSEVRRSLAKYRPDLAGFGELRLRNFLDEQGILLATTGNNAKAKSRKWWTRVWRDLG